jgi:predicted acyl esterase
MTDSSRSVAGLPAASDCPPGIYDRAPSDYGMITEKDVAVAMRDGVNL